MSDQFTPEDLAQIKERIQMAGLRIQIPFESSQEVGDFILLKGELVYLEDLSALAIGEGEKPIRELLAMRSPILPFLAEDLAGVQAQKLWGELQRSACHYEPIAKVLPHFLLEEFVSQRPSNFSFLLGEEIPKESPLYQFVRTMPDSRAGFWRNWDYDSMTDPDGKRVFGARQADAFQAHGHRIRAKSNTNVYPKPLATQGLKPCSVGTFRAPWSHKAMGALDQNGVVLEDVKETRALGCVVLWLMRIS